MKDYGIDRGSIKEFDTSDRKQRGFATRARLWGFRKMFWDYLTKLGVAFFDVCCPAASEEGIYPVRYNSNLFRLEYFDGTWHDIVELEETTTTTTTSSTTTTTTTSP